MVSSFICYYPNFLNESYRRLLMSSSLKVVNLHQNKKTKHPLHHQFLPNPSTCFRLLIFAPSNSGKSNLIKNLITRDEFGYNKHYANNIFLFSRTIRIDEIWKNLHLPPTHLYDEWKHSF
mmetsp:Transcript_7526/g.11386  ORF Transcript_7526/g.11386 Transcript_7526/m.11386 type:complete len:120 (+) Transcript_7526:486-845(+)